MTMMKFLAIYLLLFSECFATELTNQENKALDLFLRHLFEKVEAGYVLHDLKPISIIGFFAEDHFFDETTRHKDSVILREGALVLKRLNLQSDKIAIHIYPKKDSLVDYYHTLVINKPLFLKTVENNIALFQYILGPEVTPETLLNHLLAPNSTFHDVFKNNKVLIGIVLGFGTQNSLYASRIENIQDSLSAKETLPFKPRADALQAVQKHYLEMLFFTDSTKNLVVHPSFGFPTLQDELKTLLNKMDVCSFVLVQDPPFIFGRLKKDVETVDLIRKAESAQTNIRKMTANVHFAAELLKKYYNLDLTVKEEKKEPEKISSEMSQLIAMNVWNTLYDQPEAYKKAFIEGCYLCSKNETLNPKATTFDFIEFQQLARANDNLNFSNNLSKELEKDTNYRKIKDKLFVRIIKESSGKTLENAHQVTLKCLIKDHHNTILYDNFYSSPIECDLNDLLPGMAHGMLGMNEGEMREIILHPSLAYGIYTTLEKALTLKIEVELVAIHEQKEPLEPLIYKDLTFPKPFKESEGTTIAFEAGKWHGYHTWMHYRKQPYFSLQEMISSIEGFSSDEEFDLTSEEKQNTINNLHWLIYTNNL